MEKKPFFDPDLDPCPYLDPDRWRLEGVGIGKRVVALAVSNNYVSIIIFHPIMIFRRYSFTAFFIRFYFYFKVNVLKIFPSF